MKWKTYHLTCWWKKGSADRISGVFVSEELEYLFVLPSRQNETKVKKLEGLEMIQFVGEVDAEFVERIRYEESDTKTYKRGDKIKIEKGKYRGMTGVYMKKVKDKMIVEIRLRSVTIETSI